ncbi:MAG: GntR family transcriptional regulator [Verrucomicrobiae bacterium]|nr:GntR family transcriptional regulator [Verrucomicrobiae bacterium]
MNIPLNIQSAETVDQQIERLLRSQIKKGELKPATRLPPTDELARQWHVGRSTISKAMARLAAEGLIERRAKHGTFVKSGSHRPAIGILIGPSLADENAQFSRSILKHLRSEMESNEKHCWTCRVYDDLTSLRTQSGAQYSTAYQNFIDDLRNYPFQGIIKLHGGLAQEEDSFLKPDIPRVRLGVCPKQSDPKLDVMLDLRRFTREAAEFMAEKGLRHIAYLRTLDSNRDSSMDLEGLDEAARALNLPKIQIHPLRDSPLPSELLEPLAYEKTLELIRQWESPGSANPWPDALLVSDDVAAYGVARALTEKNIDVPDRLLLMTSSNEGIIHRYPLPIMRYEFSPQTIAKTLLDLLCKRIMGDPLPPLPIALRGRLNPPAAHPTPGSFLPENAGQTLVAQSQWTPA